MQQFDLSHLPDILKIEDLSALLGKETTTIRTCATAVKYAHLIPRPFKMPHSRRLYWKKEDVLAWLSKSETVRPGEKGGACSNLQRGRPTKGEQVAAERAGLTVKQWRALQRPQP